MGVVEVVRRQGQLLQMVEAFTPAASRAICTAGKSSAMSNPMIARTTSNSTSVNARRRDVLQK